MVLKKPTVTAGSKFGMPESSWADSCMAAHADLMAFLSSTLLADGSVRQCGVLQITTSQGRWQIKLKDPGSSVYCFLTGDSLAATLEAAEMVCSTGQADWRRDEWTGRGRPGK